MGLIEKLLPRRRRQPIIVVSGLPRSGTSMLMRMLEAGGAEVYSDGVRSADIDNPRGYYEHEQIKGLADDPDRSWLESAQGKAIKVIAYLLAHLPPEHRYDVVYVNRFVEEVVASQNKMLERRGEPLGDGSADDTIRMLETHSRRVRLWLRRQPNFRVLEVDYAAVITAPETEAGRVASFLKCGLSVEQMAGVVDPDLYRNRASAE